MKQVSNLYSCWSFNFTKLAWVVHLGIYLKLNMTFIAAAIPSTPILGILHMRHRCNKIEWFIYLCGGAYLWVAFGFKDLINRPRCRILICRSVAPGLILKTFRWTTWEVKFFQTMNIRCWRSLNFWSRCPVMVVSKQNICGPMLSSNTPSLMWICKIIKAVI